MLYLLRCLFYFLIAFVLTPVVESGLSCAGRIKNCVRNSAHCHITCKDYVAGVFLIPSQQYCKNATNYDLSHTAQVFVNTSLIFTSKLFLSCCDINKSLICTQTVSICDEPSQVEDHLIKCKVKIENETSKPTAICDIHQNGAFAANISSVGFNKSCEAFNKTFICPLNNLSTNHTFHAISFGEGFCKNISKETKLTFLPRSFVEAPNLTILVKKILKRSVTLQLQLPSGIAHNFGNRSWLYRLLSSSVNITKPEIVSGKEVTAEINNLHPYQQYTFHSDWKYEDNVLWSKPTTFTFTTQIDVPGTAPTVPGKNYAHGIDVTAIYLQRQPKDSENGPLIKYHVFVTTHEKSDKLYKRNLQKITFSKDFQENLRTLFLPLNDEQDHSVSIKFASAAGLSPHFTTVYISPHSSTEGELHTVEAKLFNETHHFVIVKDVLKADKLFVFWCWGVFNASKSLVNCKSNIESKEINSPRESVFIPSPEHDYGKTCVECSLHYGAAIQINNVTSSLLWDSASVLEGKVRASSEGDEKWKEKLATYCFVAIGVILVIVIVGVLYLKWKGFKIQIEKPDDILTSDKLHYKPVETGEMFNELSTISSHLSESPPESPLTSESSLTTDSSNSAGLRILVPTGSDDGKDYYKVHSMLDSVGYSTS